MTKNLAIVQTEISLHQTITALKQHAENYPAERIDKTQIMDIQAALNLLDERRTEASRPPERRKGVPERRIKFFDLYMVDELNKFKAKFGRNPSRLGSKDRRIKSL